MLALVARQAVAAYRKQPMLPTFGEVGEVVLHRLEIDRNGKAVAALNQLKLARPEPLIFYLLQSADLAIRSASITSQAKENAHGYRIHAKRARELHDFCKDRTPIHLWMTLDRLADFLEQQAIFNEDAPAGLQISRTAKTKSAVAYIALRHFGHKLRTELCMKRLPHEPIRWLTEVALDEAIPDRVVAEALRKEMGVGGAAKKREVPKPHN